MSSPYQLPSQNLLPPPSFVDRVLAITDSHFVPSTNDASDVVFCDDCGKPFPEQVICRIGIFEYCGACHDLLARACGEYLKANFMTSAKRRQAVR